MGRVNMIYRRSTCLRSLLGAVVMVIAAITLASSSATADRARPLDKLILKDGDAIVFLGDSITHQCLYTQYVEDFFYTRHPEMRLRFHNAGVGGAQALDALDRFERDVAAYRPKYVTVLLGMNDGHYRPFDQETFDSYHAGMTAVIGKITALDATPILMTPTMYDSRAARMRRPDDRDPRLEFYNSVLAYYGTWLREVAVESGCGFVDMWTPLNAITLRARKTNPNFTIIEDAVHPGPSGQVVMAFAIVDALAVKRRVSRIRIVHTPGGEPKAQGKAGGTISDLRVTDDGLAFSWKAESLPWVVPAEAREGVKLLRLGHRLSAEALQVHGLAGGRYELSIDGDVVGTFGDRALARHIELQGNAKTPQYRQALAVAELNKERNAGPVRSLRNEWSLFQHSMRLRRRQKAVPDDAELGKKIAAVEKKLEGREERIAGFERAAREIEDRIFQQNRPETRRYVLKRVRGKGK